MKTRRSGFTLIEMIVVTAILVIFAALITPRVATFRDGAAARDAVPSIQRLLNGAREAAISNKTTVVVTCDPSTNQITIKQDVDNVDQNAPTTSANSSSQNSSGATTSLSVGNGQNVNVPTVPTIDPSKPVVNKSITLPKGLQIGRMQVNGQDVATSDFQLRYYSDGRSDEGGIELTSGGSYTQSISIDDLGKSTYQASSLPDANTYRWEAGQFEPRQGA